VPLLAPLADQPSLNEATALLEPLRATGAGPPVAAADGLEVAPVGGKSGCLGLSERSQTFLLKFRVCIVPVFYPPTGAPIWAPLINCWRA